MTDRKWIIAGLLASAVAMIMVSWQSYDEGYRNGVKHGRALGRADADRRVAVAQAECHTLIENQRAWYEGLHDRAAVVWETNTRALLHDMMIYEHDLEGCLHHGHSR